MACPSPTPFPYQPQGSELSFHPPSCKEGTQLEGDPTEGEARGHYHRLEPVWPTLLLLRWGVGGEEEEEKVGREQRLSRSERLEGSPQKGDSSGSQGWEITAGEGLVRVVGCSCRLPVTPRQSRSRAAEQF